MNNVIEEIRKDIKRFLNSNKNEDITYHNLWDAEQKRYYTKTDMKINRLG
jgi:hypothetical protein